MKTFQYIIGIMTGYIMLLLMAGTTLAQTTFLNNITTYKSGEDAEINQVYIPNSFTPNGDGVNDEFRIYSDDIKRYSLKVFDEDGAEMYSTIQMSDGWDGTKRNVELKQGVYLYRIEVTFMDETEKFYVGHLNLIR